MQNEILAILDDSQEIKDTHRYKRPPKSEKIILNYKETKMEFTKRQLEVMELVAKGFSNTKISHILKTNESTIKLLIYRIKKYIECITLERIDRFYLVIIAQELSLDSSLKISNLDNCTYNEKVKEIDK